MNKKNIGWAVVGVIVLVAVFYGGMVYGKSGQGKIPVRGQGAQAFSVVGGARGLRNGGGSGGFTAGEIISKDDKSITVQIMGGGPGSPPTGGSKIIFLDSTTKISKSASGTLADLATGTQVSIMGTPNIDGSISAQSVQIRPAPVVK
jgi:hypothetical protein